MVPALFRPFSTSHFAAIGLVALLCGAVVLATRHPRGVRWGRRFLTGVLVCGTATHLAIRAYTGTIRAEDLLPLHLCDFLIFVSIYALWRRRPLAVELVYFWGCSGTALAIVMPAVTYDFPHWHFLVYFALHGAVIGSAGWLLANGERPRSRAPLRVFAVTAVYAAVVGVVNVLLDENFLFLCRKPAEATLLDYFGDWPIYLIVAGLLGLVLFFLLDLPFVPARRAARRVRPPTA